MGAPEVSTQEATRPEKGDDASPARRRNVSGIVKGVIVRAIKHDCTEVAGEMAFDFSFLTVTKNFKVSSCDINYLRHKFPSIVHRAPRYKL